MTPIVLRLRMVSGDQVDATYEEPGATNDDQVIEHILATLTQDDGALHCTALHRTATDSWWSSREALPPSR